MFKTNSSITIRRRNARRTAHTVCKRIRSAAIEQGQAFNSLRTETGLGVRASARVWLGLNPSPWAIERSREVLGLTIEQVWKVG
ncbi:hypothetical protein QP157_08605 [Sphingomonas sp. LR61]|uniref:hypothetical protein n=1 Tax=Sphingomonas sp. LR61 TaxID=3050234 RepID=UPI002FE0DF06